jgi:hypothetical protein
MPNLLETIKNIKWGADPELSITTPDGVFVPASDILFRDEQFGCDGHAATAELRPTAHQDTREVLNSVGTILYWFSQEFPGYQLYAGAIAKNKSIGGHIHIGGYRGDMPNEVINIFEILSIAIEPRTAVIKRRSGYGQPEDQRQQPHGMEFRAPLSWLLSPAHVLAYIGLFKLLMLNTGDLSIYLEKTVEFTNPRLGEIGYFKDKEVTGMTAEQAKAEMFQIIEDLSAHMPLNKIGRAHV